MRKINRRGGYPHHKPVMCRQTCAERMYLLLLVSTSVALTEGKCAPDTLRQSQENVEQSEM